MTSQITQTSESLKNNSDFLNRLTCFQALFRGRKVRKQIAIPSQIHHNNDLATFIYKEVNAIIRKNNPCSGKKLVGPEDFKIWIERSDERKVVDVLYYVTWKNYLLGKGCYKNIFQAKTMAIPIQIFYKNPQELNRQNFTLIRASETNNENDNKRIRKGYAFQKYFIDKYPGIHIAEVPVEGPDSTDPAFSLPEWKQRRYVCFWIAVEELNLSLKTYLKALGDIFEVLEILHAEGVVHRDIKCQNILLKPEDGSGWLNDFDVTSEVGHESFLTLNECLDPLGQEDWITKSSDIYGLMVCILEVLTKSLHSVKISNMCREGQTSPNLYNMFQQKALKYFPGHSTIITKLLDFAFEIFTKAIELEEDWQRNTTAQTIFTKGTLKQKEDAWEVIVVKSKIFPSITEVKERFEKIIQQL